MKFPTESIVIDEQYAHAPESEPRLQHVDCWIYPGVTPDKIDRVILDEIQNRIFDSFGRHNPPLNQSTQCKVQEIIADVFGRYFGPVTAKACSITPMGSIRFELFSAPSEGKEKVMKKGEVTITKEQAEALVAWANVGDQQHGTTAWGKYFDAAMKVAQEIRDQENGNEES